MQWRTKVRLSATVCLLTAFIAANIGNGAAAEGDAPVVHLSANHIAMQDAEAAARRHLDRFLSNVLSETGTAPDEAALKVAVPTADQGAEVIWVTPFAVLEDGVFIGILANQPRTTTAVKAGDAIRFHRDQVRDWSFMGTDAKLYGSYTTRVLLPHLAQEQAAQIAHHLSDVPMPAEWR